MSPKPKPSSRRVTLVEIGRRLNLSPRAVSQVLNGGQRASTVRVNANTRARVEKLARELGYRPNRAAQAFRTGKNRGLVGVLAPHGFESIWAERLYYTRASAEHHGFALLPYFGRADRSEHQRGFDFFLDYRVEAVVTFLPLSKARIDRLLEEGIRVVSVNTEQPKKVPGYSFAKVEALKRLTHHLIERGHSKLALVGGAGPHGKAGHQAVVEQGFQQALKEASREGRKVSGKVWRFQPELDGFMSKQHPDLHGLLAPGYVGMKKLLESGNLPHALIGVTDDIAQGAIGACAEAGVEIEGNIAFAGCSNSAWSCSGLCPLTTIRQPTGELMSAVFEDLKHELADDRPSCPPRPPFPCELVIRKSTQWKRKLSGC